MASDQASDQASDKAHSKASIKDVAKAAGVSTATVSRVLANKDFIRPSTRERVLQAVADLHYRPNTAARSLRAQRSARIGLIFSDIRNPFFAALTRAVEEAAYPQGYTVLICNTDEDPSREATFLEMLQAENVAGVIFSPTRQYCLHPDRAPLRLPVVVIDRAIRGLELDMVVLDNLSAARELTAHLLGNGYRRLAGLFGESSITGRERSKGFQQELEAHGLQPHSVHYLPPRTAPAHAAAAELLSGSPLPDAILTSNSLLTAGVLQALREKGLKIPADMALAGFDATEWGEFVDPPITVIAQPVEEIGGAAVRMLFERIAEPGRPARRVMLKGKLEARGSSAPS